MCVYSSHLDFTHSSALALLPGRCVCIFDFDETLRIVSADGKHKDTPAPDGFRVVEECRVREPGQAMRVPGSRGIARIP